MPTDSTAERRHCLAEPAASVRAEAIPERWARGELTTGEMRDLTCLLYAAPPIA
ncbi:hypothetical protein [Dactylosporangium sp. NPDC051541]|uniref:hypothetical protein n=1 Tax=Dactylosporangium sp. NPDC051541 TaxID=3363977 RepID=UPI003797DD1B